LLAIEESRRVVEVGEMLVDGLSTVTDMKNASQVASSAYWDLPSSSRLLFGGVSPQDVVRACLYPDAFGAAVSALSRTFTIIREEEFHRGRANPTAFADFLRNIKPAGTERLPQVTLLRCIFGNPFRPARVDASWLRWNDGTVPRIAQGIYEERAFDRLPVLHDALLDAGCDNEDILVHCRSEGTHVRGCWVIDLILGKE
jgi:hypothetical protein